MFNFSRQELQSKMAASQDEEEALLRFQNEISSIRVDSPHESNLRSFTGSMTATNSSKLLGVRIGCLLEGRGGAKGEIGIASISTSIPVLILSQITDSASYVKTLSKLVALELDDLIVPIGLDDQGLLGDIISVLPDTTVIRIHRKYFRQGTGLSSIKRIASPESSSIELRVQNQHYCLAAASALLDYLKINLNIFHAPKSVFVDYQGPEDSLLVDYDTAKSIELLSSSLSSDSSSVQGSNSLFGILNHCSTPGGTRLLRSNLFQPPIPQHKIQERHLAIEELLQDDHVFNSLLTIFRTLGDLEKILSPFMFTHPRKETLWVLEKRLMNIISLKQILNAAPQISEMIASLRSPIFRDLQNMLLDGSLKTMADKMNLVLENSIRQQNGLLKSQHSFAIKSGLNAYFDLSRDVYCEIVDELAKVANRMSRAFEMPIQLRLNSMRGFHLFIGSNKKSPSSLKLDTLPSEFILGKACQNGITFTTEDALRLNSKSQEALRVTNLIGNKILNKLLEEIKKNVTVLHRLSEQLNFIDMILSLTITSGNQGFVKPCIGSYTAIRNAKHPIMHLSSNFASKNIVPNSIYSNVDSSFTVIMGPNMSGKSTYLRQIALLQILFQIGCYIPADHATFKIMTALYTRFGTYDNMEANTSSFTREMKDMSYILSATEGRGSALVLMDELGRSTSTLEGASLCWALSEELILRDHLTCFLVTHFRAMSQLENYYPGVANYHFLRDSKKSFMLVKGINSELLNYGIEFSRECGLHDDVVKRASEIARGAPLEKALVPPLTEDEMERLNTVQLGYLAYKMIMSARHSGGSNAEDLKANLINLRTQFIEADEE